MEKSRVGQVKLKLACILAGMIGLQASGGWAQSPEQIAERIPGVIQLSAEQAHIGDQLVPLGTVKDGRDGRAAPEKSQRVGGQFDKRVYQLPSELGLESVRSSLEDLWMRSHPGSQLLYRCVGRECGSSNLWANDVFSESLLFGNDRTQFAYVFVTDAGKGIGLLYGSERPNRRSHFTLLSMQLDTPWQAVDKNEGSDEAGPVTSRWQLSVSRNAKGEVDARRLPVLLNPVISNLTNRETRHWAVIAHTCEKSPAPEAFRQSQQLLDAVLPLLQKVQNKEFHPVNAGNALPCSKARNLEVVELQP